MRLLGFVGSNLYFFFFLSLFFVWMFLVSSVVSVHLWRMDRNLAYSTSTSTGQ